MNLNLLKFKYFLYGILLIVFFGFSLVDFGFPKKILYLNDLFLVLCLALCVFFINKDYKFQYLGYLLLVFALIVINWIFGAMINGTNPLYFLRGLRNNSRFFIFFFLSCFLLDANDINKLVNFAFKFSWLNLILCIVQFYILGYKYDYLGGVFGVTQGCNTYLNIYISFIMCIAISKYMHNELTALKMLTYVTSCFYISFLSELKVFYFLSVLIIFGALLTNRFTKKSFSLIFIFLVYFCFAAVALYFVSPSSFDAIFNSSSRDKYLSGTGGYTGTGDLNRFTALTQINDLFFNNTFKMLFGFGLGNTDTASFNFLVTPFYEKYSYLHYRWFSHSWIYLEQGAIGLILLILFLLLCFIYSFKYRKHKKLLYLYSTTTLFILTTFVCLIYNSGIQMEAGYLTALILAIPFILNKKGGLMQSDTEKNSLYMARKK